LGFRSKFTIVSALMTKKDFKYFIPALLWAVVMLIVSSIPYLVSPPFEFAMIDKVEHFSEYFILAFWASFGYARSGRSTTFLTTLTICSVFGILDELHQLFIPGRSCDVFDMLADILGSAAGAGFFTWLSIRIRILSRRLT
jgi:VanZ family protein